MRSCSVLHCVAIKNGKNIKGVSFHEFPVFAGQREKWINAIYEHDASRRSRGWMPGEVSCICSQHFDESDFKPDSKNRCLRPNVVPSIFPSRVGPQKARPDPKQPNVTNISPRDSEYFRVDIDSSCRYVPLGSLPGLKQPPNRHSADVGTQVDVVIGRGLRTTLADQLLRSKLLRTETRCGGLRKRCKRLRQRLESSNFRLNRLVEENRLLKDILAAHNFQPVHENAEQTFDDMHNYSLRKWLFTLRDDTSASPC